MKRLLSLGSLLALAVASLVFAQTSGQATLRTPTATHPFTYVEQSGQIYVSAHEVTAGLGGSIAPDSTGFKVTVGNAVAAFGPDSRYGVVRDDLIEMPVPPITIEGRPFVPWQFFQGFLASAASMDVAWDAATRTLAVAPLQRTAIAVQVSVANVQGISKVVLTLNAPAEHTIVSEPGVTIIRFRAPVRASSAEQTFEDPYVARIAVSGSDVRIQLTAPDVVGDAYQLNNPPRVVVDFRKGAAGAPGSTTPLAPQPQRDTPGIRTIVIDPGHGGREVGAVGPNGLLEKDLTLAISRKLAAALSRRVGARVVLTREDDSLVSLDQRTAIANQYEADLFLSVHMNAAVVPDAKGSETYFLSLEASDELARKAAETENAAHSDASSDLKLILWDLAQQAYLDESSRFAQSIQEALNAASSIANRGVKQAPFKVLVGATMPAALVEVGFITNAEEEAKLQTDAFQNAMVEAIVNAVERYKTDYETRIGIIQPAAPVAVVTPPAAAASTAAPARPTPQTGTGQ
jgi:N-acetylmuramoyl-L-alanine amidase